MTKRKRLIKLVLLFGMLGLILLWNNKSMQKVLAADEPPVIEQEVQFYRTVAEDLTIDENHVLLGFSEVFTAKKERNVTLVIPENVQVIAENSFAGRCEITTVELPTHLPEIQTGAFANCNGIVEVYDASGEITSDPQMTSTQYGSLLYYAISFRQKDMPSNITIDPDGQVFCKANRGIMVNKNYFVGYLGDKTSLVLTEKEYEYDVYQYAFWENDEIESVNTYFSNAKSIGNYAFYSCDNLKYIILPDTLNDIGFAAFQNSLQLVVAERYEEKAFPSNLKSIGDYAFDHTALSGKIVIPKSVETIGENAFYSCNIDELIFEDTIEGEPIIELTIHRNAFRDCTKLAVVELPTRLKRMYLRAFLGTGLSTVYIHSTMVEYGAVPILNEANVYFPNTATIIYDTKEAYLMAKDAPYINVHASQMAFLIPVRFTDGVQNFDSLALSGRDFDFVKGGDGIWTKVSSELRNALIPTQNGYAHSLWYKTEDMSDDNPFSSKDSKTTEAAIEAISYMLQNAIRDGISELCFYARRIEKPNVYGKSLTYNENDSYSTPEAWAKLLETSGSGVSFDPSLMNLFLGNDKLSISDAGEYTLIIQLKDEFGAWLDDVLVNIVVDRKMVYLNNVISWSVNIQDKTSDLLSGSVYVYKNAFGDAQYSYSPLKPEQIKKGFSFYSVMTVTNSIVRSRSSEVGVSLNTNSYFDIFYSGLDFTFEGTLEEVGQNQGLDNNVYAAKAIIKAKPNYSFRSLGDVDTITNSSRGLTIDISEDRTEARITKVWFILDVSNSIFEKGTTNEYEITGWKYKQDANIVIPVLEHASSLDILKYSLIKDQISLIEEAGVEAQDKGLLYYLNDSMPAGDYILTLHIPDVELDGILYFGYNATYTFTVEKADFKEEWKTDAALKLKNTEWQYCESNGEGIVQVYHHSEFNSSHEDTLNDHSMDLKIWTDFIEESLNPERKGYWALAEADSFYSTRFALTYNLDRMQQNRYYTYTELESTSGAFSPKRVDDYIVYYQLKANNYTSLVNELDDEVRREYSFIVTIFDCIEVPTVSDVVYNGLEIKPILQPSYQYTVEYEDEEYISAGTHTITLTSVDALHYRWNRDSKDEKCVIQFTISPSKNQWLQNPNILSWEYDGFIAENNLIFAEAKYGSRVAFAIAKDEDGKNLISGLEEFYTEDGRVTDETIIALLKHLPASSSSEYYYLIARVQSTANFELLENSTRFQVFKSKNTWEITPNVMQWKFGNYDKNLNLILASARIKDENNPALFTITQDKEGKNPIQGLENFTADQGIVSDEIASLLAELKANTYYLFTKVKETASYAALEPEPYEFQVTMATNYWDVMPTITSWVEGQYNVEEHVIQANAHFGNNIKIKISVAGSEDQIVYDSEQGINLLDQAKVGIYELTAYVDATKDYSDLSYSFTFQIFEKPGIPWWGVLLIVLGALGLVALVLFILHQSGVLQLLSGKIVIAMRTKATVDATIAAVRANKVAEESKKTIAIAKQKELTEARKKALEDARNRPLEERAAILDQRAKENAERADKFKRKADQMQIKADRMLQKANKKRNLKSEESDSE